MSAPAIAAFDIGGTWFRSALVDAGGTIGAALRRPAINYRDHPDLSPSALQAALVDWLSTEADRLCAVAGRPLAAAVSLGAAVDHRSGLVLGSGPLWGPLGGSFDLAGALAASRPSVRWTVVNDVTAALLDCMNDPGIRAAGPATGRIMLITVSTGIAARTAEIATARVPVDPVCGLQGEIGHLPVSVSFAGRRWRRRCDCGGADHLNAFTSGRGIAGLLNDIRTEAPEALAGSPLLADGADGTRFAAAVLSGDRPARALLDAVTRPLADILRCALTIDPEIGRIVFTGGVVHALGRVFLDSLSGGFADGGLYQITEREPDFFASRLSLARDDDASGLRGAALAARAASGTAGPLVRGTRMMEAADG